MIVKADDYNSRTHTECDRAAEVRIAEAKHYNSRTHTECDIRHMYEYLIHNTITIHALIRSAIRVL